MTTTDILFDAARDSMGVYPQATRHGDGEWIKRTEWQEGWNAALLKLFERLVVLREWSATQPLDVFSALTELLQADTVFMRIDGGGVQCYLALNDVFDYGGSYAEDIPLAELPQLAGLYREFGWGGLDAWAAKKIGQTPIKERITEQYTAAMSTLEAKS